MTELQEGLQLKAISYVPDPEEGSGIWEVGEAVHQCSSITVTMEAGQMGWIPWAKVVTNEGRTFLVNLANVESVEVV